MADAGNAVTSVTAHNKGGGLEIDGTRVVGTQASTITDAVVAHNIADAGTEMAAALETEVEGFLNAIGVQINLVLVALEKHGLVASL